MVTVETVRTLALALPQAEEALSSGTPAWKVGRRLFAHLSADGESLAVKASKPARAALSTAEPDKYTVGGEQAGARMVVVRLAKVEPPELREVLTQAWRSSAPRRLVKLFDAGQ